eukprot:144144-Rhodomonas_salina.1
MKPNPLNDQRSAQEKTLHDALAAFEKEDAEWTALLNAPAPAPPAPPRAGAPVLEELSIADRNLLSSRATDELPELVGWAQVALPPSLPLPLSVSFPPLVRLSECLRVCVCLRVCGTRSGADSRARGPGQGLVATGLDKMRAAVANAEEQAHKAAARRE